MSESIEYPGAAELRARLSRAEAMVEKLMKFNADYCSLTARPPLVISSDELLQSKLALTEKKLEIAREGLECIRKHPSFPDLVALSTLDEIEAVGTREETPGDREDERKYVAIDGILYKQKR